MQISVKQKAQYVRHSYLPPYFQVFIVYLFIILCAHCVALNALTVLVGYLTYNHLERTGQPR